MAWSQGSGYNFTTQPVHIGATGAPGGDILLRVTGEMAVSDNITAYYSSDISLKDNIRPIESAIFKVKQIRGVTFDWNEKSTELQQEKGHDVGLIAQEVEKVLPEVVQIREDGIMAIQYEKVVPLLVESIKELINSKLSEKYDFVVKMHPNQKGIHKTTVQCYEGSFKNNKREGHGRLINLD